MPYRNLHFSYSITSIACRPNTATEGLGLKLIKMIVDFNLSPR